MPSSHDDRPGHAGVNRAMVPIGPGSRERPIDGDTAVDPGDIRRRPCGLCIEGDVMADRAEGEGDRLAGRALMVRRPSMNSACRALTSWLVVPP